MDASGDEWGAAVIAEKCLRERRVVSSATARAKRKAEGGDLETQRLVIISPMLQGPNVRHTRALQTTTHLSYFPLVDSIPILNTFYYPFCFFTCQSLNDP